MSKKKFGTRKRYCVNHAQNTVEISRSFQIAASRKGTPEYNVMMSIHKDFPSMEVTIKTYHRKGKPSSHLTYGMIETYLECLPDKQKYIHLFNKACKVSRTYPDPPKEVRKWFLESFPDFNKPVRFDKNGDLIFRYVSTVLKENTEPEAEKLLGQEKELDDVA
jgi:hypothetical protein